ncbi:MAG: sterol desaturase family protein [Gammaproteobacteria bacterium]|nr:sterol desaturase family protein [Gammaproteobacteria bacterium]
MDYILSNQTEIFGNIFYSTIIGFLLLELLIPFRTNAGERTWLRWFNNIFLGGLNIFLVRFLLPVSTIGIATLVEEHKFGFLNNVSIHLAIEVVIVFLIIDLAGYLFHKALHTYRMLWRFHLVHHSDLAVDITTSVRHHPVEALMLAMLIAMIILLLGAPVISIFLYQVVHFFVSMFSHANIKLPSIIDRVLRLIIITPDFHRIHHSIDKIYTNSNYGNVLTWWDYLFASCQAKAQDEQESMPLGLEYFRSNREQVIDRLITQPFRYSMVRIMQNSSGQST